MNYYCTCYVYCCRINVFQGNNCTFYSRFIFVLKLHVLNGVGHPHSAIAYRQLHEHLHVYIYIRYIFIKKKLLLRPTYTYFSSSDSDLKITLQYCEIVIVTNRN